MSRRVLAPLAAALFGALVVGTPVAAAGPRVDRVEDFGTVLAVRFEEDFPRASLMRADCDWLIRVERRDGSAREVMHCRLSDVPVMVPEFQGSPPERTFHHGGGACTWTSDYWWIVIGAPVFAESFRYVVTPQGHVLATATYPAEPLSCG